VYPWIPRLGADVEEPVVAAAGTLLEGKMKRGESTPTQMETKRRWKIWTYVLLTEATEATDKVERAEATEATEAVELIGKRRRRNERRRQG